MLEKQQGGRNIVVMIMTMMMTIDGRGGQRRRLPRWELEIGGRREVFEEFFEGLVTEELVPPLRESLLQVGRELFPKFHPHKGLKRITMRDEKEKTESENNDNNNGEYGIFF